MDLSYPIGRFTRPVDVPVEDRRRFVDEVESLPVRLRQAINGLSDSQLDTAYRPNGWTVRQVVHHLADSHMNSFLRFRLALTEDEPLVKTYNEKQLAELFDARMAPVELSLAILDNLHRRWVMLLRSLTDSDFRRTFRHPEMGPVSLEANLALYAWHGKHHVAHIANLRACMGWH